MQASLASTPSPALSTHLALPGLVGDLSSLDRAQPIPSLGAHTPRGDLAELKDQELAAKVRPFLTKRIYTSNRIVIWCPCLQRNDPLELDAVTSTHAHIKLALRPCYGRDLVSVQCSETREVTSHKVVIYVCIHSKQIPREVDPVIMSESSNNSSPHVTTTVSSPTGDDKPAVVGRGRVTESI